MHRLSLLFFCLCFIGGIAFAENDYTALTSLAGSFVFEQESFEYRLISELKTTDQAGVMLKEFYLLTRGYVQKAKAMIVPEDLQVLKRTTIAWFKAAELLSQTASDHFLASQGLENLDRLTDLLADVVSKYKNWVQEWERLNNQYNFVVPSFFAEGSRRYPNDILKYNEHLYDSLEFLAVAFENAGMFEEILKFYLKMYPFDPENYSLNWHIGIKYQYIGDSYYKGYARNLDIALYKKSQDLYLKARPFLLKAASLKPSDWGINLNAGLISLKLEEYAEALDFLMKADILHPNDGQIQLWIGKAYLYGFKDMTKALEYYAKAKQLRPEDWQIYWYTAAVYVFLKDYEQAKQNLIQARELAKKWPNWQHEAGEADILIKQLTAGDILSVEKCLLNEGVFKRWPVPSQETSSV